MATGSARLPNAWVPPGSDPAALTSSAAPHVSGVYRRGIAAAMAAHAREAAHRLRRMNARDPGPLAGTPAWSAEAQAMYRAAQAVSRPGGAAVFARLVHDLADILHVATAFVAVFTDATRSELHTLAAVLDGKPLRNFDYALEGSPCAQVVGHAYRHVAQGVSREFRPDTVFAAKGMDSYAAFPLFDSADVPLGLLVAMDRQPIADATLAEALLKIFAGRIVAEIEQLRANEALRRSESSYRAIFESAEIAIFIHDWDTGAVLDANPKACATYGYSPDEMRRISVSEVSSGVPPYTGEQALRYIEQAKQGLSPVFEWHRRNKDGSLHWDEVRLKVAHIDGKPHVLAYTHDITHRKAAEAQLRASEEQYRAIFDASADPLILWDSQYRRVDVNPAYERVFGWTRDEVVGRSWDRPDDGEAYGEPRRELVRRALAGETCRAELASRRKDGAIIQIEVHATPFRHRGEPHVLAIARDVTERKRAEQALRASEEQYRAIFNASADALVLRDADFRIVDVNATYERMSGWTRDAVLGLDRIVANPADVAASIRALHERALGGEPIAIEVPLVRRDGTRYEIELRGMPIRHRGEPHVLYMGRDVTERKRAEQALRASEEQYRVIFDGTADAMIVWDPAMRIADVNAAFTALSGYRREEVLGLPLRDFIGGSHSPAVVGAPQLSRGFLDEISTARCELGIARALQGHTGQLEMRAVTRTGQSIEIEMRYMPIVHGNRAHVLSVARDVTERRERERELQRSAARLRATVEAAFDSVIGIDGDGRIVEFNAAAERCFGHRRERVLGRQLADVIVPPQHREGHTSGLRRFREGIPRSMVGRLVETTAMRADGTEFPVEVAISVAQVPEGSIFVGHVRDISARRRAEAERAALEAQLRQAQKMEAIGQLTGGIAHDFNNILTAVIGYLVLGQERAAAGNDAKLVRQLESAHLAAQRARDLIAQMLTFTRRQGGERRALAPGALVRQSLQLLRSTLPSSLQLEAPIGDDDTLPAVLADAVQLEQVLFNLCINARDAMDGSGTIRVELRPVRHADLRCTSCGAGVGSGPWVELSVADSGSGIAPDVMERMFEPFFSTKAVGRGSGMGLAMVHGIVHNHGGHIVVESEPGRGSRFGVLWPLAEAEAAADGPTPSAAASAEGRLNGRVMVVEDEPQVGAVMAELLAGWGLQVVSMHDPLKARDWLAQPANELDLLLTDHTMPQMTGLQLAQHASTVRPALPVLLYTGDPETEESAVLHRHGVRALLRKPVEPQALRTLLQRWLAAG